MKKLALAVAAALGLAGVTAAVTSAVTPTIGMSAKASPNAHGTKKKPKKVKLVIKLSTTPNPADPAFAADSTVVHLPKELAFGGKALKQCSKAQVLANDLKCPKGSKVGSGTAMGSALGANEPLTVRAYNGPAGKKLELLVDGQTPLPIHAVIEGVLSKDTSNPAYGSKLTVNIPPDLQQPAPGVYATLTEFDTTINAVTGKKKVPYVGMISCKTKIMKFGVDYHYQPDGTTQSTTTTAACK